MPATENQPSFLGRISIRRNQVVAMDGSQEQDLEDLELFQKHISDRFSELLPPQNGSNDEVSTQSEPVLSISWIRKLVDVFLCCEAEFKAVLIMGRDPSHISKPPLDRLLPELLDRTVKALDICNAVSSGVDCVRQCQKLAEMTVSALEQKPVGDGQVKRAKKALNSMFSAMYNDDKDHHSPFKGTERTWSFGRKTGSTSTAAKDRGGNGAGISFRTSSTLVAKNWSAAKQIQAMAANLAPPRGAEATGLATTVYTMSAIIVFVMNTLVAAIPCQERTGLGTHFQIPKNLAWAHGIVSLQERIGEDWKKKEKKGSAGLLDEMQKMERLGLALMEFADAFQFPGENEKVDEVAAQVAELAEVCRRMDEGLVPLQQQIREVFHRIVRSRGEVLDVLEHNGKVSAPVM